jgi:hypothetical protein
VARRSLDGLGEGHVTPPFTAQPIEAIMAAQTSAGLVLGSMLWLRRMRPAVSTWLLGVAVAFAVLSPVAGDFFKGVGVTTTSWEVVTWLKMALAGATVACVATSIMTRRWLLGVIAVLGTGATWEVLGYITSSDGELAATVLAFLGLLIGLHWRLLPVAPAPRRPDSLPPRRPQGPVWVDDVAAFVLGTLAGVLACWIVLHGWTGSGDEWGDTYQAALFAKLRAYAVVPHCSEAFRAFWVFQYMGRSFAQYTPGWPLFMAPFVALHLVWLAGPASLGLLAAGVGRLARRAASGFSKGSDPPPRAEVRAAGRFAAGLTLLSSTVLINGGSRYPHVFVAAMFAWSVEALLTISTNESPPMPVKRQWQWGATLGSAAVLMLAARPGDGATLGVGLFLYFAYALVRRRMPWRAIAGAAIPFAAIGALTLVILRLQLGRWFVTGYSLASDLYPWAKVAWSLPKPDEYKTAITLATGAYCWWPLAPSVGMAGIAAMRGRAQRIGFVFFFGVVPLVILYTLQEMGRTFSMGYGPRYLFPAVVPMAVGGGVVFGQLWTYARSAAVDRSALAAAGPAVLALTAVLLGVVRIAPLIYPFAFADSQNHNRLHEAIAKAGLENALVFASASLTDTDPMDLPENLPPELYPNQDVLIAVDHNPDETQCVRRMNPTRTVYRALPGMPGTPVRIVRE